MKKIQDKQFFKVDTKILAKELLGKWICRKIDGRIVRSQICETEAYLGVDDSACHTYKGKHTPKVEPMWQDGGTIYIYLCYGMHYMLNIVSEDVGVPEAVLIRAVKGAIGPGRVTKLLGVDKSLNGISIVDSDDIWLEDDLCKYTFREDKRVGINYARECDREAKLRFILE